MQEKRIYIIRHGQTDNNVNYILQGGRVNSSLNKKGFLQSQCFYEAYKHIPFKKIYTSDLVRSRESVEQFIKAGIPWEASKDLNEIDYGIYDGKASNLDVTGPYHQLIEQWKKGLTEAKIKGGENPIEVQKRVITFLNYIMKKKEEDLILICMHRRIMRIFISTFLHLGLNSMDMFKHSNLCLYVLLKRENIICIEKFNDTSHLEEHL